MNELKYYLEYFYYSYVNYSPVIRIVVFLIMLFVLLISFLLLMTIIKAAVNKKKYKIEEGENCYGILEDILTNPEQISYKDLEPHTKSIQAKCGTNKQEIIEILITIKDNNIKRFNYFNSKQVVRLFALSPYWNRCLSEGTLKSKMDSLQNIIELNATIAESVLLTLVYHKNDELRKRARVAQIHLSQHDPFRFFEEEFDEDFTQWDKVQIHNILLRRPAESIPNFMRWMNKTTNENLRCFFIYEIGFYKQTENSNSLFELFKSNPSDQVKIQILETLGNMNIEDYREELTKEYYSSSEAVQYAIIKSFEKSNDRKKFLPFLKNCFEKAYNTNLMIEIGNVIYGSGQQGKETIDSMKAKSVGFRRLIFDHIENPLIKG